MQPFAAQPGPRPGLSLQQAVAEAHRCLLCHDAPCGSACPGGTDPGKFIRQIRFYNLKGAARTVLGNNPLGGVCAYVCPTAKTCVGACLRTGIDRPIDIAGLQRFAVEYGRQMGLKILTRGAELRERVAVVGAGPAGLAAAARLTEYGYRVTLFDERPSAGGMLRYGVPETRLPEKALDADVDEIRGLGIEFRTGAIVQGENGIQRLLDEGFAAVFVAPGLWKPHELGIPGADLQGVATAIDFLSLVRTARDKAAALVQGANVAVVGGGSVAMDVATSARRLGAGRVYAVAIESMTELPALPDEIDEARRLGIVIKPQCQIARILGAGGRVAGVEGHETEWVVPGKLVPENARPVEGTSFKLRVGAVIQAIGQGPTDIVGGLVAAARKRGKLLAASDKTQATSIDRVFAGGDIVRGPGTVVDAVADGKRAAQAIHDALAYGKEVVR